MPKSSATGTLKMKSKADNKNQASDIGTTRDNENLKLKIEAVRALGLWEKVRASGWGALTAAESGSVGGYMTRVRAAAKRQNEESAHNSS